MKELAIGEIGEIHGIMVLCVAGGGSDQCFFKGGTFSCLSTACMGHERSDGLDVHFEEVKS